MIQPPVPVSPDTNPVQARIGDSYFPVVL